MALIKFIPVKDV